MPPQSPLSRGLEPLYHALWPIFLGWSVVAALFWGGLIQAEQFAAISNTGLRDTLSFLARSADVIWLVLGTVLVYFAIATKAGLGLARQWALIILSTAAIIAVASTKWGYPMGYILFTQSLGLKLGPVPLGWPLLWFVLLVSARDLTAKVLPRASHWQLAAGTGLLLLLTSLNLEPVVTHSRYFWFWYHSGSPLPTTASWSYFATWALVGGLLALGLPRLRIAVEIRKRTWKEVAPFLIFNSFCLLSHLRRAISF